MNAGAELLAELYESLKQLHKSSIEQGFKTQALELTLRSFPDTKPMYEAALEQVKTPKVLQEAELLLKGYDAAIAIIRSGQSPSA